MPIIEFFVVAALILYIIRFVFRLVLPMLLQGIVNRASQQSQNNYRETHRPDTKVKVDYAPKTKSQIPDSEGDFIDYEEIK